MSQAKREHRTQPVALGTGLIALDVVLAGTDRVHALWAGGTCGNVLTILSFLGWRSYPLARFNGDGAAKHVREDLLRWGVRLDFADLTPSAKTPVVIHRIERNSRGEARHRFSMRCPLCGARTPSFSPVRSDSIDDAISRLPKAELFFLDRVSRSAIRLAAAARAKGALVYFEPSANGLASLVQEALRVAHVVKYSHDRMGWLSDDLACLGSDDLLQIETLGEGGLRVRGRLGRFRRSAWQEFPAYRVSGVRDAAGSGDWCSAVILNHLLGERGGGFDGITPASLKDALQLGQAAGAWNCFYEGARGGMYELDRDAVLSQISQVRSGQLSSAREPGKPNSVEELAGSLSDWCNSCEPALYSPSA